MFQQMMLTRDKRIGKSTYRIVKASEHCFAIQETREGRTAVTSSIYTMDDAIRILTGFDRENLVIRSK